MNCSWNLNESGWKCLPPFIFFEEMGCFFGSSSFRVWGGRAGTVPGNPVAGQHATTGAYGQIRSLRKLHLLKRKPNRMSHSILLKKYQFRKTPCSSPKKSKNHRNKIGISSSVAIESLCFLCEKVVCLPIFSTRWWRFRPEWLSTKTQRLAASEKS